MLLNTSADVDCYGCDWYMFSTHTNYYRIISIRGSFRIGRNGWRNANILSIYGSRCVGIAFPYVSPLVYMLYISNRSLAYRGDMNLPIWSYGKFGGIRCYGDPESTILIHRRIYLLK